VPAKRHLLLTGSPGCGKTTVIRKLAAQLASERPGGFYTEEIRAGGVRRGFRLVTFGGAEAVLAHVDLPKTHRVGKYGVDVAALDAALEVALQPSTRPACGWWTRSGRWSASRRAS
jgi:nucleoside-triphosphatase